jgi:hypothetical protein
MFLMFYFSISVQTVKEPVDVCLSALNSFKIAYFRPYVWPLALSSRKIFQVLSFLVALQIHNEKGACFVLALLCSE